MTREKFLKQSIGSLTGTLKQSRVLLVGAGGIGCELLKNLLLTGFGEIHVIDLDTIDLSNLNRQFLFRHEHIKKSKSQVAKEVANKFRPDAKLTAYHANIKDSEFNVDWFSSFNIVFNALDNLDARRHVNRMCLAANVPLIESGTTGFNGQVQVIMKGKTECYDCTSKPVPKSFPVCTIRSTPSQPIHCIVWAKSYLLPELFGTSEDASELDETEDAENAEEIKNLRKEAQELKEIRSSLGAPDFAQKIFNKVFTNDVIRLRNMEDAWKSRKAPEPLSFTALDEEARKVQTGISAEDQKTWTLTENLAVFKDSLDRLSSRLKQMREETSDGPSPVISFDKDDVDTLDFVSASANLRSAIFSIDAKSKFDIKQMAGNIIPAIATTNAMTAAMCVLQSLKVLKGDYENAKMVFLERSGARAINTDSLKPPNPNCPVCSNAQARIYIDPEKATLNDLVEGILRLKLGYGEEFSISSSLGTLYEPDLEDNLSRKLTDMGVKKDTFLTIIDEEDDNPRVNLELLVSERSTLESSHPVALEGEIDIPKRVKPAAPEILNGGLNGAANGAAGKKRTAAEAELENGGTPAKKATKESSVQDGNDGNPIVLDDDSGAILIDD